MARNFSARSQHIRKYTVLECVGAGDSTIIAGVAERRICVLAYTIVSSGAGTIQWKNEDAGTNLSGGMPLVGQSMISASSEDGLLETATDGEGLVLSVSTAITLSGHMTYTEN